MEFLNLCILFSEDLILFRLKIFIQSIKSYILLGLRYELIFKILSVRFELSHTSLIDSFEHIQDLGTFLYLAINSLHALTIGDK